MMSDGWLMAVEEVWEEERRLALEYPEHHRLSLVKEEADVISAFLEWLEVNERFLGEWDDEGNCQPWYKHNAHVLAEYFDIDLNKITEEKNRLLEKVDNAQ